MPRLRTIKGDRKKLTPAAKRNADQFAAIFLPNADERLALDIRRISINAQ